MARSVTFNGITRFRPGGITRVNADALASLGVSAGNVLGLIGEADGGVPGSAEGFVSLRDPSQAVALFRSGDLVDAIRLAFQSSGDPRVPGGASEVVVYKVNNSTQSSVQVPDHTGTLVSDTAAAGSSTTLVNVTTGGLVVDALIGRWVDITLAALPGSPVFRRQITDNAASSITVSPALPSAPAVGNVVVVRPTLFTVSSRDYGAHTESVNVDVVFSDTDETYQVTVEFEGEEQTSEALGGQNFLQLYYRGGANSVTQDTILTPASVTATTVDLTTAGLVAAAHVGKSVLITNPATGNFEQVVISANTITALTFEAPGLSDDFVEELQAATLSTVTVDISTVTDALATVTGASGVATAFTTTITGVTGDNLNIALTQGFTVQQLVDRINQNSNYLAVVPAGINGNTALARAFDFGTGTAINIQKSIEINDGLGMRQDLAQVVAWLENSGQYTRSSRYAVATTDGGMLPRTAANVDALFVEPFQLFGGSRGVSTNSGWQTALDSFLTREINHVVTLIDQDMVNEGNGSTATWASVAQQLRAHVVRARGPVGFERGGYIGFIGNKNQYIAACRSINDTDVQCVSQNPQVLNAQGTLETKTPKFFAVQAASMRCGMPEIGEPLTHKFILASDLTQDASWDPSDATDSADLILAGALFAEVVTGEGIRWVRDLTTHVQDDNLAYSEGSVRDVVRYVAYNLRRAIERRYTGRKATPITIATVKDTAASILEVFRSENIIVDSVDATGAAVRAYFGLKVFSSGDVVRLVVGIFPVPGINFQLHDIYLSLPRQVAA